MSKRDQTRAKIYEVALGLFREKGFDKTTMRDIAKEAGMSLGAAYYHFPSKDALILEYYAQVSTERARLARKTLDKSDDLRERLGAIFHVHVKQLRKDHKLLGALVRSVADPESDLSVFSAATKGMRNRSLDLFSEALNVGGVPEHTRDLGALGFWVLDLAFTLYLTWDTSRGQKKTKALIDATLDMMMPVLPILTSPLAEPMLGQVAQLLLDAGLVPED